MKNFLNLIVGVFISLLLTFILEAIFALVVKSFCLSATVIRPVNQVIKAVSIIIATLLTVKYKGVLFGASLGVLYGVTAYLIMSGIAESFYIGRFFLDILFCTVVGILSGLIAVNLKKR